MPRAPQKIRNIIFYDWETSGLKTKDSAVMSLAAIGVNRVTLETLVVYDNLIKPYDQSLIYNPQALAVNGLTKEKCEKEGVTLRQLMEDFCQICEETNIYKSKAQKPILCSHNAPFDRNFLMEAAKRAQIDLGKYLSGDYDPFGNFIPTTVDTIELAQECWGPTTDNDSNFKLGTCCQKAGILLQDGHNALADTRALADLYRYFATRLRSGSNEVTVVDGIARASHRINFQW